MGGYVTWKSRGCSPPPARSSPHLRDLQGRGEERGLPALPVADPSSQFLPGQLMGFGCAPGRESLLWHSLQCDIISIGGSLRAGCLKISSSPFSPCGCPAWRGVPTSWGSRSSLASHPGTAIGSPTLRDPVQKKSPCPAPKPSSQSYPPRHPWEPQHQHPADPHGSQLLGAGKKERLGKFAGNPAFTAPVPCPKATPAPVWGRGQGDR